MLHAARAKSFASIAKYAISIWIITLKRDARKIVCEHLSFGTWRPGTLELSRAREAVPTN